MPPANPQSADPDMQFQAAVFEFIGETLCGILAGLLAVLVPVLVVAEIVRGAL